MPPDTDGDNAVDVCDNCPSVENANQRDTDGDLEGDVCDVDDDDDGLLDSEDLYPLDPVPEQVIQVALDWLNTQINEEGSWDTDAEQLHASCAAVQVLRHLTEYTPIYWAGYTALYNARTRNTSQQACVLSALTDFPAPVDYAVDLETIARAPVELVGTLNYSYPDTGWGLTSRFTSDPKITAEVLAAFLDSGSFSGTSTLELALLRRGNGLEIRFDIPAGNHSIAFSLASQFAGNVDWFLKEGAPASPTTFDHRTDNPLTFDFIEIEVVGPTTWYGLAVNTGTITAGGFVTAAFNEGAPRASAVSNALLYAIHSQKTDGSWGRGVLNPGDAQTSCEVLRALLRYGTVPADELTRATNYLLGQQQVDGSMGSIASTAACHGVLHQLGHETAARSAYDFLLAARAQDGSYDGDALLTAATLEVLSQKRRIP